MPGPLTLEALDLAALLCSRVCHDLISPVGAVVNGIEVMEDDADEQTKVFAIELIKKSATTASARLQFCRLAFGAAGSAGASIDTGDAESVARGMMEDDKTKLTWKLPRVLLPKNKVKLLLNLVALGVVALPRGGTLHVTIAGTPPSVSFTVSAKGDAAKLSDEVKSLLAGTNGVAIDAHSVQPYYARRVATAAGMVVKIDARHGEVELTAA